MIKNINGSRYINITGAYYSDPYISPGSVGAGMLRWNPNMNCMEVSDGSVWKQITTTNPTVELTQEAQNILDWAKQKMEEESRIDGLCEKYPGLGKARDNYETFLRMVESQEPNSNS